MSAYRFCRTDDIGLLVEALNRCWAPYFPDEPATTAAAFKRSIRDQQVWCSSCMVAFEGAEPIGVLIGAKRPSSTLVHKIAVHPDHRRRGHGQHLLASLGSKLAILGPPRIVAEVPEILEPACSLFSASGYEKESLLTDYLWRRDDDIQVPAAFAQRSERAADDDANRTGFVIPVTIDDLAANGLLEDAHRQTCWDRSVETLTARKNDIAGLAVASDEQIEAFLLYMDHEADEKDIVSLRSFVDDGGARLNQLVCQLRGGGAKCLRLGKISPAEIPTRFLESLGFRRAAVHQRYVARARS
jgi:GNAT superfamily N-acetyltransferase